MVETNRLAHALPGRSDADAGARSSAALREQRLRALGHATEIRSARAALKNDLAAGRERIEEVLARPPEFAATARVSDLLLAVPGIGPVRATRALARCQIPYQKTAAGLSTRQRVALIALLHTENQ